MTGLVNKVDASLAYDAKPVHKYIVDDPMMPVGSLLVEMAEAILSF